MGRARPCAVYGCTLTKFSNFNYYKFPKNKTITRQWLQKCYRADTVNVNHAVICDQHFSSAQIKRSLKYELLGSPVPRSWRDLKTEAVPDQNLPFRQHDNGSGLSAERDTDIIEQPANLTTLTERYVHHALSFIKNSTARKTPFFLYLPFHQVHHPQFASRKFHGKSIRGIIGDALLELDWAVSEVVKSLNSLGVLSSTIIWFSSDNGPSLTRHERGGCAGPLRCGKGTTWEGGVRVPTFVSWPGKIKPGYSSSLASTFDVLPTIMALTEVETSNLTLDGFDISSLLWDPQGESPRKFFPVYPETPLKDLGPFAVRNDRYKAHFYTKGSDLSDADNYDPMCPGSNGLTPHDPPLLFDLQVDPGERYNLGLDPKYKSVIDTLTQWRDEHMLNMTWMEARTRTVDERSQPCCSDNTCDPFPKCCDCPIKHHLNHIFNYPLYDRVNKKSS